MKQRTIQTICAMSFLIFLTVFSWGNSSAHILRVADGTTPSLEGVIEDLLQVQIILIGETHDHPAHHRAQLQIINALREKGAAVAIGLEMFRTDSQEALDRWIAGQLSEQEFRAVFNQNWFYWEAATMNPNIYMLSDQESPKECRKYRLLDMKDRSSNGYQDQCRIDGLMAEVV